MPATSSPALRTDRPVSELSAVVSSSRPGKLGLIGRLALAVNRWWLVRMSVAERQCCSSSGNLKASGLYRYLTA